MVVIDAEGTIVGRMGARVAKMLLSGQEVEIINAEKAIMAGSLVAAKEKYESHRNQKNKRNPEESPHWPRAPQMLLRRMLRGMLPWKSQRGRDAYKRLRVSVGAPAAQTKTQKIKEAVPADKYGTFTLAELCKSLGYNSKTV